MTSFIDGNGADTIAALTQAVEEFADAREWQQFHDPKNLSMALASEVGELSAILRWVRNDDSDAFLAAGEHRARLQAEVGDVGICLLLLCARTKLDLGTAIRSKLRANSVKYPAELSRGRAEPPARLEGANAQH